MHRGWSILLSGLALGALSIADAGQSGPVYRWTDEKGVVHYGDSVPPEYSQGGSSVLNSRGVEIGHVEGVGNAAATAEKARAAETARQRAQHDQFLLSTYLSTKDIEQLRDERLSQVDGQIKASALYIDGLDNRLLELIDRSSHFKPYSSDPKAKRMPDDLVEELVRVANESSSQHQALDAKRQEQVDMRSQFDADIARFRELTSKPRS
jgi:hypothetical protein